jgi:thiazole synthase
MSVPITPSLTRPAESLTIGGLTLGSRLVVGTGKYRSYAEMARCLEASGTDCVTVAVRRERLVNAAGENILDHLDPKRYTILPNTAGCFTADEAVRVARLGRDLLRDLENRGSEWVIRSAPSKPRSGSSPRASLSSCTQATIPCSPDGSRRRGRRV